MFLVYGVSYFFFYNYMFQGEETSVIVVPGSWECDDSGIWDFFIAKECYARTISMRLGMSYDELICDVATEFELSELNFQQKLSYWLPCQLSIFSVNRRPPVVITTDIGVRNFLRIRRTEVHLNLLLSLEASSVGSGSTGMRRLCLAAEERAKQRNGDDGGIQRYNIGTTSPGIGEGAKANNFTSVRRRLFGVENERGKRVIIEEGGCSNSGMLCQSKEDNGSGRGMRESSGDLVIGTNCTGIISLVNAVTPSLSVEIVGEKEKGMEVDMPGSYIEDVLPAIEAIENRHKEMAKERGKSIVLDSVFEESVGDSEGYATDGVQTSDCEESALAAYENWGDYLDYEVSEDFVVPVMDEVGPSSPKPPEGAGVMSTWFEKPAENVEKDVGEEVLAYVTNSINIPLSLQNFYEDYNDQGTLPTTDAEPVFDDIIDLTNTNGCAPASAEEDAIYVGRVFKDKEDMQNTISIYAIKRLFHFRQTRSDPTRLVFVCVDPRCRWRVFGHVVSENSKNFEVRTATLTHTCTIMTRAKYAKHASAKVIGSVLQRKYANGVKGPRAVEISDIVLDELKVSVSYMKVWYAKEAALRKSRGSDEDSYKLLARYMYLLQQGNPGTVYNLECRLGAGKKKQFKYLLFSLGASIAGIKHMRKVIQVDATTIKSKFKGVLLAASMQDANFQVFPIAFGIVDSENIRVWTWFFRQLSAIVPDAADLVLVSDRHRSIYAAVGEVYPLAFHGACVVHIERNVRHYSGKGLASLVGKAARAFNVGDFKYWYSEIATRSKKCAAYLEGIPLEH